MTFGQMLRRLRDDRKMTLRQLGDAAGMDYVILNKVELGTRMAPPLEGIIALADALNRIRKLKAGEFEKLLELAAEPNKKATARFTSDELARLKESTMACAFFTRRGTGDEEGR